MDDIIVTGATGFIGRNLIPELIKIFPKETILCLIRDKPNELEITGRKILEKYDIRTKEIDLTSGRGLNELPENPKLIIHLGASTESGDKDHNCNDIGTKNLLEAFSPLNPELKIIFTSTAAVYSGRKDVKKPIDENTELAPSNEYGRSKVRTEKIFHEYTSKFGFSTVILRLGTVWGKSTRRKGIFDSLKNLICTRSFITRLNWPGKTSLVSVNDVVNVILFFALEKSGKLVRTYVVSHEGLTVSDISKVLHYNLKINYEPINIKPFFWITLGSLLKRSHFFDKILPSKLYNFFWRLNLIVNDTLYCKPDEIKEKLPELNLKFRSYSNNFSDLY
ncbi:MAG: NAD(P)-dependent oxidoreductase [Ignavibacteria bacterium]